MLKVLELEKWMTHHLVYDFCKEDFEESIVYYKEIKPIYNRNGIYYDSKLNYSWFELNNKAYEYPVKDFIIRLNILNASEFTKEEIKGLENIIKTKFANKKQISLYYDYIDYVCIRNTKRNAHKLFGK